MIFRDCTTFLILFVLLTWLGLETPTTTSAASDSSLLRRFFYKFADDDDSEKAEPFDFVFLQTNALSSDPNLRAPCDENKLMLRLANMQITSPERIVLLLTTGGIYDLCKTLKTNMEEVRLEFKHCRPLAADNLYWLLFNGVIRLHDQLCLSQTSEILQKLSLHYGCLNGMREELIDCEGPADWFEKSNQTDVCTHYKDILDCQYVRGAELCGLEPAQVLRCISNNVLNGTMIEQCNNINMTVPMVANPMPLPIQLRESTKSSANPLYFISLLILLPGVQNILL